jgi:hemoglobin-like flavoprotein
MASSIHTRSDHLFILRTWYESDAVTGAGQWRGMIEHPDSGRRRYFAHLDAVETFVTSQDAWLPTGAISYPPVAITPAQIHAVQSTFRALQPSMDAISTAFFERLFEVAPDVQSLFKTSINVQAKKFTTMLTVVIDGLDQLETIRHILHYLGKRHAGYGVHSEHYALAGSILLAVLQNAAGESFTPEARAAWAQTYSLCSAMMQEPLAGLAPAPPANSTGSGASALPG